jgi:protein involved in polysaccharide export with SLBB domain
MFTDNYIVTETGKISISELGVIEAAGLSETQLEEEIKRFLAPSILKTPSVSVILLNSEQRMFSIQGNGVPLPNRYPIPRYDFRLLDALTVAGGVDQFNISYIYVTRRLTGKEALNESIELEDAGPAESTEELSIPEGKMLEIIKPCAKLRTRNRFIITTSEMVTEKELTEAALPEGFKPLTVKKQGQIDTQFKGQAPVLSGEPAGREVIEEPIDTDESSRIEWVFEDGKWVPVRVGPQEPPAIEEPEKSKALPEKEAAEDLTWGEIETGGIQTRVIRIPTDKLFGGDSRYNVIIKPGDNIHVPVDIIGEFYMMGNLNNQGAIILTGRPMTLKMAIASAGGLGPLAWPKRCEVTRRIGKYKEETVMIDLDKIASGEQPDFYIKANDLINVGTHPTSGWRAVLRNAFRASYGFGFVYDRNFADRDFGTSRPIPNWF